MEALSDLKDKPSQSCNTEEQAAGEEAGLGWGGV